MSEARPDLKKYTKDELIWLVERVCYISDPFGGRWHILEDALADLERRRSLNLISKADGHAKKAHDARAKAIELMAKHNGMKMSDIDPRELEAISTYLKEAQKEDEAYMRTMRAVEK